ncbi:hypothetical protein CALCODRAFT_489891 [Calocera cornea HHB12733]|uniref:Uncharacterized protein n=1 Tax=Calocera cornea HHB12733 TaxID=1353952 RepID=A0A165K0R4_9BASI|nr:hypothetical protein CALCODRAFT_489891 [Calocera cornea HHB12733]
MSGNQSYTKRASLREAGLAHIHALDMRLAYSRRLMVSGRRVPASQKLPARQLVTHRADTLHPAEPWALPYYIANHRVYEILDAHPWPCSLP